MRPVFPRETSLSRKSSSARRDGMETQQQPQTVAPASEEEYGGVVFEKVSVVVPVFNEEGNLEELYRRLSDVLADSGVVEDYELLFLDDGSTDESGAIIEDLAQADDRVRQFRFRSNRGKSAALNLGFRRANGDAVVTIDADLQDQPSEIPRLLRKLDEYDLVSGWKVDRKDPISKTLPSRFFNWVTGLVSNVDIHDFNCGLKAYRRELVDVLDLYGEMHRFIPAMAGLLGYRVTELPVQHAPRTWGKSKYGWSRLLKGAYDLLTVVLLYRFGERPMHFFGSVGVGLGGIGFVVLCYLSYLRLVIGEDIGDRPLLLLGILLMLTGIQLISTGLIGELLVSRSRPRDGEVVRG